MNEEREAIAELSNSGGKQGQQISSLHCKNAEELETVLATLLALPFKDEIQRTSFLEHVQRLQGYHIIQLFNFGVVPLQRSLAESSAEFIEEVIELVEICLSFCYTTYMPKRVAFEYYVRALKFCFPLEPKQCLATTVVAKLLQLVQIFQEGKLADITDDKTKCQASFLNLQFNGTNYFFGKFLQIFESRRHGGHLEEIIDETLRIASEDARHATTDYALQTFEHVVSPVFVRKWMKLLMSTHVNCTFAVHFAKVDSLSCTEQSTICYLVSLLEEMKRNGIKVSLPCDKERLNLFFNHLKHVCEHPSVTVTLLKLLAVTNISTEVLRDVLEQFFYNEKVATETREIALQLVFIILSLLPDGELVKKVLTFWKKAFSADPEYQALACLLALFVEEQNNEAFCLHGRAETIFDFVEGLPHPLFPLISVWQMFLWWFMKIFPTTFESRPEVLVFVNKAAQLASRGLVEERPTLEFLKWISEQNCTEEMRSEMIQLLLCYTGEESFNWLSPIETWVIKSLCLCPRLPFTTKERIACEHTYLTPFFKQQERTIFNKFVENIASNQTLENTEEILIEFLNFFQHFVNQQTSNAIPENVLNLLSLLSSVPISGERRLKVLHFSMKSEAGLVSSLHILKLIQMQPCALKEGTDEYFDLLFAAIVQTLKGDNDLCEKLCNQHRCHFPSTSVLKVWSASVAGLLSLGLFKEEIDSGCCCPVLQQAWGFSSPFEILQLLFEVRSTAVNVARLSRGQKEATSSCDVQESSQGSRSEESVLLRNFVLSVSIILGTYVLSSWEKIRFVKKLCDIVLRTPRILTTTLINALINSIPYIPWPQSNDDTHQELNRIDAVLEDPKVLNQLWRIPVNDCLSSGLSTKLFNSFSRVNLVDIVLFIGSLQDLDQIYFDHLLPFLEVAIQRSRSAKDVLEILTELVLVLRNNRPEMTPFIMLNFAYLIDHPINKQDRDKFLTEVAMMWELPPSYDVLSFLEIPRLLWKVYNIAITPAKRMQLIDRLQQILKKRNEVEDWRMRNEVLGMDIWKPRKIPRNYIRRRIACCELEWFVIHSFLSTQDVALACDLSCRFFQRFHRDLRCCNFPDVQIEDGILTFVPQEQKTASRVPDKCTESTSSFTAASTENSLPVTQSKERILTPALIGKEVIFHLHRVLGQDKDPTEIAFSLWDLVFSRQQQSYKDKCSCVSHWSVLDDYVDVVLSIVAEAPSIEVMFHWARLNRHHVCQCSDVILKACKWNDSKEDGVDMEALLNLQSVVSTTLEEMRLNYTQRTNCFLPWLPRAFSHAEPCFRHLMPQLKQLGNLIESRLPIAVTTRVLELYQINIQAGVTVGGDHFFMVMPTTVTATSRKHSNVL